MTDPDRPRLTPDRPPPAPRGARPSLRRTIARVAGASVTAVALVWSGLTMNALATRHAATAPPAPSPTAATTTTTSGKHSSQAAAALAPVTTKTS
ncbi:hypothetical protein [Capillimicrobium parvum]|uniref:Uncharacterized protein n=1 Tax=Capillimicrobium parvum TaxID=2884022 RepID=A0A9E6Y5I2_9ACTN|nr:hypothetical protein [Capillimicrobium parvum]UGS38962.1 hypothetical protein DSM104329_05394 [Capillimicrobium parvum]